MLRRYILIHNKYSCSIGRVKNGEKYFNEKDIDNFVGVFLCYAKVNGRGI